MIGIGLALVTLGYAAREEVLSKGATTSHAGRASVAFWVAGALFAFAGVVVIAAPPFILRKAGASPEDDVGEHLNLAFGELDAAVMPETYGVLGWPVWRVFVLVENRGPAGSFTADVVRRSVSNVDEAGYPNANFALQWQTPNDGREQKIGHGLNARLDVAIVVPDARIIRFLGPRTVWMELHASGPVHGEVAVSDCARGLVPPQACRFVIEGADRSCPVRLIVDPDESSPEVPSAVEPVSADHRDLLRGIAASLDHSIKNNRHAGYGSEVQRRAFREHFPDLAERLDDWDAAVSAAEGAESNLRERFMSAVDDLVGENVHRATIVRVLFPHVLHCAQTSTTTRLTDASWFGYDDDGKVVLCLRQEIFAVCGTPDEAHTFRAAVDAVYANSQDWPEALRIPDAIGDRDARIGPLTDELEVLRLRPEIYSACSLCAKPGQP